MDVLLTIACGAAGGLLGPMLARVSRVLHQRPPAWSELTGRSLRAGPRAWACGGACAALFALAALRWGPSARLGPHLVLFAVLVVMAAVDLEHLLIPNRLVFPSLAAAAVLITLASMVDGTMPTLRFAIVGAVAYFTGLFVTHLVSPNGLGFGDVKLALLLGLFLGWAAGGYFDVLSLVLFGLLFASLLGSVIGVLLLVRRGRGAHYPFGPWLAAGTVFTLLAAPALGH
jgi:leader peptidase (prepilin peptidase)/N-methyltransferase